MISRLTFCAALFAAVTTVSLAYAADSAQAQAAETARSAAPRRHRRPADGRSDRQARPLEKHFATGAAPTAPTTAPGPHEDLSCGPFLFARTVPEDGKSASKGAQGIAAGTEMGRVGAPMAGTPQPILPGTPTLDPHGKLPAAAPHRRIRDQRRAAVAGLGRLRRGPRAQPARQPPPGPGGPGHRRLRPVVAGPLPRAGRSVGRPRRHSARRRHPGAGAGRRRRGDGPGRDPQDGARVRRPVAPDPGLRLRPLAVRHARPLPRQRRRRLLGTGRRDRDPHRDCWSASASGSSRAASSRSSASCRRPWAACC